MLGHIRNDSTVHWTPLLQTTLSVMREQFNCGQTTQTAQHIDSVCVSHYFEFAKNADSVPQTYVHGVTTAAQTVLQNTAIFQL